MPAYEVGQRYSATRTIWPETADYNYRAGGHELRLFWRSPAEREVRDVRQGDAELALYVEQPLILLCHRFGRLPWSDSPFSLHLVPATERDVPPRAATSEPHALLTVILVDADTGIIRALRAFSLSPAFTTALHLAIREQAARTWDPAAYDAALDALYARYTRPEHVVARAQARYRSSQQPWSDRTERS